MQRLVTGVQLIAGGQQSHQQFIAHSATARCSLHRLVTGLQLIAENQQVVSNLSATLAMSAAQLVDL